MRRIVMTGVFSCLAVMAGCNKSEQAAVPAAPAPLPVASPQTVVTEFLEAVRTGADKVAEAKLTELAREKTRKMDLMVAPPGSPTAKYEVGAVEIAGENQLAYVESRWTDVGSDGKPEITEFVWALRMDNGQWRIGGVATQPYPNMPFLQLDFENPEDMLKQSQLAEQEYQRQLKLGTPSAAAGGNVAAANQAPGTLPATGVAGQPGALPPGTASAISGSTTTNPGLQTSFDPAAAPNGLASPSSVQPAGGLPATPAQNNSLGGAQQPTGVANPGVFNSGTEMPFQAQQPPAGNPVPR
jgi:hypothetical protein